MQKECFTGDVFSYISKKKRPSSSRTGPSPLIFLSPRKQGEIKFQNVPNHQNSTIGLVEVPNARGDSKTAGSGQRPKLPVWLFSNGLKKLVSKSRDKTQGPVLANQPVIRCSLAKTSESCTERNATAIEHKRPAGIAQLLRNSHGLARRSSENSEKRIAMFAGPNKLTLTGNKIVPSFAPGLLEKINSSGSSTTDRKSEIKHSPVILERSARIEKSYKTPAFAGRSGNSEINIQNGFALDVSGGNDHTREKSPVMLGHSVSPSRSPQIRSAMPLPPDLISRLIDPGRTESIAHKLSGKMSPRTTSCELLKMSFGETPRTTRFECDKKHGILSCNKAYGMCTSRGRVKQVNEDKLTIVEDLVTTNRRWKPTEVHNSRISYIGVFDGHGGAAVSHYLSENLHQSVASRLQDGTLPPAALKCALKEAEDTVLSKLRQKLFTSKSGSTALITLIQGRR